MDRETRKTFRSWCETATVDDLLDALQVFYLELKSRGLAGRLTIFKAPLNKVEDPLESQARLTVFTEEEGGSENV